MTVSFDRGGSLLSSLCTLTSLAPSRTRAIWFDGCLGWLHRPDAGTAAGTAVLICNGIGREAAQAHRSLRLLADRAAAAGYPALRFDYRGTGDSLDPATPDQWETWLGSVHRAADRLREETGARTLVLVGFRLGALLAGLTAAERGDVAGLMLIEPTLRGRSFLTQMATEAKLRPSAEPDLPGGLRLGELWLSDADMRRIGDVDLRRGPLPCVAAVALFGTAGAVAEGCLDAWRQAGIAASRHEADGLEVMLRPAHMADELAGTDRFLDVLRGICPPWPEGPAEAAPAGQDALTAAGFGERAIRFGDDGALAGILCEPEAGAEQVLLMGNTGGDPHHGFARFSVELARRLAVEDGIATFRFDFAGLGDSVGWMLGGVEQPTHVFTVPRRRDFRAALDLLAGFGYRRFALFGLCSGAFHALEAAAADERVEALVAVNLPLFSVGIDKPGPHSQARRVMAALERRGARVLLLYGRGDAGLSRLESHFDATASLGTASVAVVDGIDHDLTDAPMRRTVGARVSRFLGAGVPADGGAPAPFNAGKARHVGSNDGS